MVPVASSASLAGKAGPAAVVVAGSAKGEDFHPVPMRAEIITPSEEDDTFSNGDLGIPAEFIATPIMIPTPAAPVQVKQHSRRTSSKTPGVTRFTELETIESNTLTEPPTEAEDRGRRRPGQLPTQFDAGALPSPREIVLPVAGVAPVTVKTGKLSKGPAVPVAGKLVKKNRWSLRGKSTAVAV